MRDNVSGSLAVGTVPRKGNVPSSRDKKQSTENGNDTNDAVSWDAADPTKSTMSSTSTYITSSAYQRCVGGFAMVSPVQSPALDTMRLYPVLPGSGTLGHQTGLRVSPLARMSVALTYVANECHSVNGFFEILL